MSVVSSTEASCGVKQMYALPRSQTERLRMLTSMIQKYDKGGSYNKYAFIMFSDNIKATTRGQALVPWIRENKLGTVVQTGWARNPNTGNKIKAWMWRIDWKNVRAMVKE